MLPLLTLPVLLNVSKVVGVVVVSVWVVICAFAYSCVSELWFIWKQVFYPLGGVETIPCDIIMLGKYFVLSYAHVAKVRKYTAT
jgi:hypothetical protein